MKMCTSAIQTLPLCQSPDDIEITLAPREQDRRERELATLDRDRMSTMGLIGSYACKMVVHPMLGLLQVAGQRPLAKEEVLVCKEFALLTTSLVQSLFDNEMRCVSSSNSQGHGHGHRTHAALTDGKADAKADAKDKPGEKENGTEAVVAQGGATESQVAEVKEVSKSKSNALSEAARAEVVEEVIPAINIKALVHLLLYAMHQESIAFRHGSRAEIPVRHMSTMVNCSIASLASLMSLTGTSHSKKLPTEAGADQGRSCDYDVCEALSQAMTEGSQLVPKARLAQLQAERSVDALRPVVQQMIEDGSFDTDRKLYRTERVSTIAYVWLRDSAEKEKRRLLVTTTRFRLAVLEPSDASLPGRSELCLSRGVRDMRDIHRGVFHRRMRQLMLLLWEEGAVEGNSTEAMIFDSSQRQRWFVQALRRVPRGRKESEETTRPRKNAMGIILRSTGILEVTLNPAPLGSLLETCQVRRGGIPLVGVAFVEGQDSDLELLVLTRCSLTVVPFHSFWGKLRQGDAGYYEKDESIIQLSMETDSEDDRLPPFKENLVAATNDTEEKCEARQGPFDIEELQGVWFLSEAVPKVRLQFNSMLEVTFTSDGERQRFRRQLAGASGSRGFGPEAKSESRGPLIDASESRSSSPREVPSVKSCTPRRRPVLSRGAPKACAAGLVLMAKDLLKSPRIVAAASGAFQRVMVQANWLHQSLPKERSQMVAKSTQQAFEQLRSEVLRRQLGQELDSFSLTRGQLDAFLSVQTHMSDMAIQEIGANVAKALEEYFSVEGEGAGKEGMRLYLLRALQPRILEIRRLWRKVDLGALHGPGLGWGVSVDPAKLYLVQTFDPFRRYWPPEPLPCSGNACVARGSFNQARVLLLQLQALLQTFGMRLEVANSLESFDAYKMPFLSELLA
ncbi:unnamed protein product, partial [Effrenium voratum]